jgi:hypothetical protein
LSGFDGIGDDGGLHVGVLHKNLKSVNHATGCYVVSVVSFQPKEQRKHGVKKMIEDINHPGSGKLLNTC